jgi:hypothetical protein
MRLSRPMSLVEAAANVPVGLAWRRDADRRVSDPRFGGIPRADVRLALVFTTVSLADTR